MAGPQGRRCCSPRPSSSLEGQPPDLWSKVRLVRAMRAACSRAMSVDGAIGATASAGVLSAPAGVLQAMLERRSHCRGRRRPSLAWPCAQALAPRGQLDARGQTARGRPGARLAQLPPAATPPPAAVFVSGPSSAALRPCC